VSRETGAAAVEFALVLPILALLLIGMIEFGVVLHRQAVLTQAGREGARAGIIQSTPKPTAGAIERVVRNFLAGAGWNPGEAQVIVVGAGGQSGGDLAVRVESRYRFLFLANFVPGLGNALTLRSQTIMKHE
jgi:Flp pilus assembly protein TadG